MTKIFLIKPFSCAPFQTPKPLYPWQSAGIPCTKETQKAVKTSNKNLSFSSELLTFTESMNASRSTNLFIHSYHHFPPHGIAPPPHSNMCKPQSLYSLWRKANGFVISAWWSFSLVSKALITWDRYELWSVRLRPVRLSLHEPGLKVWSDYMRPVRDFRSAWMFT